MNWASVNVESTIKKLEDVCQSWGVEYDRVKMIVVPVKWSNDKLGVRKACWALACIGNCRKNRHYMDSQDVVGGDLIFMGH